MFDETLDDPLPPLPCNAIRRAKRHRLSPNPAHFPYQCVLIPRQQSRSMSLLKLPLLSYFSTLFSLRFLIFSRAYNLYHCTSPRAPPPVGGMIKFLIYGIADKKYSFSQNTVRLINFISLGCFMLNFNSELTRRPSIHYIYSVNRIMPNIISNNKFTNLLLMLELFTNDSF
jgi:hypothetical protein